MARLSASERANLPDSAFAYVDSAGKRRLPINDESHVRNALSRFGQVAFESDAARETARRRLLQAAKRHGIVPVGFIDGEIRSARRTSAAGRLVIELSSVDSVADLEAELRRTLSDPDLAVLRWSKPEGTYVDSRGVPCPLPPEGSGVTITHVQGRGRPLMAIAHDPEVLRSAEITDAVTAAVHLVVGRELIDEIDDMGVATGGLPDGVVTFLLTDIEGSTPLLHALGDRYAEVLAAARTIIREAVLRNGGRQVEARADEFVAVFDIASLAIAAAAELQRAMAAHPWPDNTDVRVRVGLHTGEIMLTETGYVGLTVHTAARIMAAAHGGQVMMSAATAGAADVADLADGLQIDLLGRFPLRGLVDDHELLQLTGPGLATGFPPPAV